MANKFGSVDFLRIREPMNPSASPSEVISDRNIYFKMRKKAEYIAAASGRQRITLIPGDLLDRERGLYI